jgi:tetratricopeptide (TPR) repeat protein
MRELFAGRIEEAERLMDRFAELGPGGQGSDATDFYYVLNLQAWAVRREQGRLAEVESSLQRFVDEYPTSFIFRCLLASVHGEAGRTQLARDALARDDLADVHGGSEWFLGAAVLAEVCALLADTARAAPLYKALAPYADCNVFAHPEVSLGSASRHLGLLAAAMSRWDDACRHFERAIAVNSQMGSPPCVAHTQEDYGRALLARGRPGDRERALELMARAFDGYRQLGMETWAKRVVDAIS